MRKQDTIYEIDPRKVDVVENFNARSEFGNIDELAEQIKENGQMSPVTVVPVTVDGEQRYKLVDGERRYRAICKLVDSGEFEPVIRAVFVDEQTSQKELLIRQMMLNEGKPFTDYELAHLCNKMRNELGMTNSQIAKRLGKNPGHITYLLEFFDWDPYVQEMVKNREVSIMSARRIFSAAKSKYGADADYRKKAVEEFRKLHDARKKAEDEAVSETIQFDRRKQKGFHKIHASDLYYTMKETKEFLKGWDVLERTVDFMKQKYGVDQIKISPRAIAKELKESGGKMTLEEAIRKQFDNTLAIGGKATALKTAGASGKE